MMNTQAQGRVPDKLNSIDGLLSTKDCPRKPPTSLDGSADPSNYSVRPRTRKRQHIRSHPAPTLPPNAALTKVAAKHVHQLPHSTPANSTPNTTSELVLGTPAFISAGLEVDTCAILAYDDPHTLFSVSAAVLYVCPRPPKLAPLVLLSAEAYDVISSDVHSLHALVVIFGPSGWPSGNW